ncbi:hypothetical protein NDU88_006595 [Pleurodeles waltl]|uniref:Uncharacterized protein n=1 Tax=Pleurodeles waltl TaxID=8319 RepID=A0AAV7MDQ4_PLEWA|nr:hypothetical protein NDU88_006595 [Pleurodeles waltl]
MSGKRRAKQRDIRIGDQVLVRNRQSGSKFMLPLGKDPWVMRDVRKLPKRRGRALALTIRKRRGDQERYETSTSMVQELPSQQSHSVVEEEQRISADDELW